MAKDVQRRNSVFEAMHADGLDALVCYSPSDILLVTGYWPVMGASLAFLTPGGEVQVILPKDEIELAEATTAARLIPYQPETLERLTVPAVALVEPVRQLAQRLHLGNPGSNFKIGLHLEDGMQAVPYQSVNLFRESILTLLHDAFPQAQIVAADSMLARLKAQHTSTELGQMRRACDRAAAGFAAAPQAIVAGRREDEVAADLLAAFTRVANDGFERGHGMFFCMSGSNAATAAAAYARTRRRVLQPGDFVMIHANTTGDGYWTDITRNYIVGAASEKQHSMQSAIVEARDAALKAIAPGARASDIDRAARDVLRQHGFGGEFKHAVGHGVGFAAADANAIPRLHPKSPDVLEAGMTFNIEPAIYLDGLGGMRHCDVVACTAGGAEVLTDF